MQRHHPAGGALAHADREQPARPGRIQAYMSSNNAGFLFWASLYAVLGSYSVDGGWESG
ncbi:hypothetical protein BDV59DRAFT_172082 [Aspergillus ambiguus]|uniref:uncharacterized protein n=1 Tax=Aspergillus ambiguus TaxID=176160 RepID=UPI003CCD040D